MLQHVAVALGSPAQYLASPQIDAERRSLFLFFLFSCCCGMQGVFLTFAKLSNGQNSLTRIRFNRQHFDKAAASVWWQNNKAEMGLRYNIASNSGTPTGLHTPDSEPATNAGLSPPHHRWVPAPPKKVACP